MRKIIHLDLDCFYAAVEEKHNPTLKGKPLGIGGPSDSRGVLCTANYAARKFGVKAAMSSAVAKKLCPDLILIPPHFDLYKKESQKIFAIYQQFSKKIETLSLDEAFLDVSEARDATQIAQNIRELVRKETHLTVSAGVAPNKFLAKVASDWKKPDGCFVIKPHQVESFVKDLPVSKIFGIGKVTNGVLAQFGIKTCGQLQSLEPVKLKKIFGNKWQNYLQMSQGIDDREVTSDSTPRSLSIEETFENDLTNFNSITAEIHRLFPLWVERLESSFALHPELKIKACFVKIRYSNFEIATRVKSTHQTPTLSEFENLAKPLWERASDPVRLIGFGLKFHAEKPKNDNKLPLFAFGSL